MHIDPYILAFSAVTVIVTIWMGFRSAKTSKTASDFFVAGRSVSVGWNASAISGEYLSAASFMGIAGMVMSSGYDALWYPVCYACGYLFLLLFIAGPLRRFGAYTIPDFAEGRYDSPVFRKIAVCFVLFIGFFYTMPQMKGAGVTLAYIFPGLPYWVGVVLVGAVITLNVALGGMKGITLVQAFQYWAKMFAISVPIFVLMAVYGNYGKQLELNGESRSKSQSLIHLDSAAFPDLFNKRTFHTISYSGAANEVQLKLARQGLGRIGVSLPQPTCDLDSVVNFYSLYRPSFGDSYTVYFDKQLGDDEARSMIKLDTTKVVSPEPSLGVAAIRDYFKVLFATNGLDLVELSRDVIAVVWTTNVSRFVGAEPASSNSHKTLSEKAPTDWLSYSQSEATATDRIAVSTSMFLPVVNGWVTLNPPRIVSRAEERLKAFFGQGQHYSVSNAKLVSVLLEYTQLSGRTVIAHTNVGLTRMLGPLELNWNDWEKTVAQVEQFLATNAVALRTESANTVRVMTPDQAVLWDQQAQGIPRRALPDKAPADSSWLSPFGPLTTKAAKAAKPTITYNGAMSTETIGIWKNEFPSTGWLKEQLSDPLKLYGGEIGGNGSIKVHDFLVLLIHFAQQNRLHTHNEGVLSCPAEFSTQTIAWPKMKGSPSELTEQMIGHLRTNGITLAREGNVFKAFPTKDAIIKSIDPRPYSLLYTYSLIIALVCGTAGLPHILVRFYTNPDGVAAKRTTMWVMILIGIFYVFPPVFGVMGRNLMPELYNGLTGVKGTDGIVLRLPTILREKYGALGSILSGVTCAGAFAAFMSTFSGLLVSMTGALAHDVYGRMLRPKSTSENRLRAFKVCAVLIGSIAIVLGCFVEPLEINFMVGQAFAIAAASYFPLLFMSVWWRGMTMRGAAIGMLTGGLCALFAVTLTNFSNLASDKGPMGKIFAGFAPMNDFWAHHPLSRILCEQPAIWTVPLAIGLMIVISKLTHRAVPPNIRMKMLVLHAPEKLGLKQEYIQEHQPGGH